MKDEVSSFMVSHGFEKSSRVEGEWWKYSADGVLETYATTDQATYWYDQTQVAVREAREQALKDAKNAIDKKNIPDPYGRQAWYSVDKLLPHKYGVPEDIFKTLHAPDTKLTDKENV